MLCCYINKYPEPIINSITDEQQYDVDIDVIDMNGNIVCTFKRDSQMHQNASNQLQRKIFLVVQQ